MISRLLPLVEVLIFSTVANAQPVDPSQHVTIVDGYITLNGTYKKLAGIEVKAPSGLSIGEHPDFPGISLDVRPFSIATGHVVANTPTYAVIGVLRAANRIDIEGVTRTGIMYSEGIETARTDLCIFVGQNDDIPSFPSPFNSQELRSPSCLTVVPEPSSNVLTMMAAFGALLMTRKGRLTK